MVTRGGAAVAAEAASAAAASAIEIPLSISRPVL
jgi:hypothetical protein